MNTGVGERRANHDEFILRYRNPLARDFVIVSQVVLIGYPHLSDGAKITYWVIYGHDWYEPERGGRKGFAYPTVRRLAQLRHTTDRTIQRHLTELIDAGLLTRVFRRGKPSTLYIEEPGKEETEAYLQARLSGGDKNVGGGVTKMSPHKEDKDKKMNSVNGVKKDLMEEGRGKSKGWTPISKLVEEKVRPVRANDRTGWVADQILAATGDSHSLGCYRTIAQRCSQALVFEALSLLKEARRDGSVQKSRGALFIGIIRRLCRERGLSDPLEGTGKVPDPSMSSGNQGEAHLGDLKPSAVLSMPNAAASVSKLVGGDSQWASTDHDWRPDVGDDG